MRELGRLIVVACLSFAVVGATMIHTRGIDIGAAAASLVTQTSQKVAALQGDAVSQTTAPDPASLFIPRPRQNQWIGLSGFPDQAELSFPVPDGAHFISGQVRLRLDSQLADHGDGLLTIALNGRQRGKVVLNPGHEQHDVDIDLDAADLMAGSLLLELSSRGTTNSGQICPTDTANSGSAIAVLPTSGLALLADAPITDPDISLLALAEPLNLALGTNGLQQAQAIWAAQTLDRSGIEARLGNANPPGDIRLADLGTPPVTTNQAQPGITLAGQAGIAHMVALRKPTALAAPIAWPVTADQLGAETLAKTFRASRRWTLDYKLADLPSGLAPTRLDLALKTSTLAPGDDWVVRISLNGSLLDTRRFAGTTQSIAFPVALPAPLQDLANQLVIELIDTSPNQSICRAGPDAQAQLLPQTQLATGTAQPLTGWAAMVHDLAAAAPIALTVQAPLDPAQAQRASWMLGQFLPRNAIMATPGDIAAAQITIATSADLQSAHRLANDLGNGNATSSTHTYLVTASTSAQHPLTLTNLAGADLDSLLGSLGTGDIALLIRR